jgi:hypothetical protein
MKSIKWSLLTTAALASLVFTLTIQQQNVEASSNKDDKLIFNQHSHTQIDEKHGVTGNDGTVLNSEINGEKSHTNTNFNTNRGETFEERSKCNSHSIPASGDVPPPISC